MAIETSFTKRLVKQIPSLTVPQQKIAQFVLDNPFKVAVYSIDEFATTVGTSTASANRFVKALGYSGYAAFRQDIIKGFESVLDSVHRLKSEQKTVNSLHQVCGQVLHEVERNLALTRQSLTSESCERVIQLILAAKRVFILGLGSSAYLSGLMERRLFPYKETVFSLNSPGGIAEAVRKLTFANKDDLVIVISFPRYLNDTIQLAKSLHKKGIPILAFTDKLTSPIVPYAQCVLYAHSDTQFGQNSEATSLALIEAIMACLDYSSNQAVDFAAEMAQTLAPWIINPH